MPKKRVESVHMRVWVETVRVFKKIKRKGETMARTIHEAAKKLEKSRKS